MHMHQDDAVLLDLPAGTKAFPILGADFLSNFRNLVDISSKRMVAHGGQLIQLEPGKHAKAAVVMGVVAVALMPVVVPSQPSLPQWRHLPLHQYPAAAAHGGKRPVGVWEWPRSPEQLSRQLHLRQWHPLNLHFSQ